MFTLTLSDIYAPMNVLNCPGWTVVRHGEPKDGRYRYFLKFEGRHVLVDGKPVESDYIAGATATSAKTWTWVNDMHPQVRKQE